jgi:hypothetical protein
VKSVLLIFAMLSGLWAETTVTPMNFNRIEDPFAPGFVSNDVSSIWSIGPDFSLASCSYESPFGQNAQDTEPDQIPVDLDLGPNKLGASVLTAAQGEFSESSIRMPEPPAIALITLGMACFGISWFIHRIRKEQMDEAAPARRGVFPVRVPIRQ